jgi:hypothetical protein
MHPLRRDPTMKLRNQTTEAWIRSYLDARRIRREYATCGLTVCVETMTHYIDVARKGWAASVDFHKHNKLQVDA